MPLCSRRGINIVRFDHRGSILILTVIGTTCGPYWSFYWPWQSWPTMPRKFWERTMFKKDSILLYSFGGAVFIITALVFWNYYTPEWKGHCRRVS